MRKLELMVLYEDGGDGWIMSSIPALPGALSQGRTRERARENVLDALALILSPEPIEEDCKRTCEVLQLSVG